MQMVNSNSKLNQDSKKGGHRYLLTKNLYTQRMESSYKQRRRKDN